MALECLILVLAARRITSIINREKIAESFRAWIGIKEFESGGINYPDKLLPNLIACFYCLSVWVAAISLFVYFLLAKEVLYPFALSEGVLWLEQVYERLSLSNE